VEQILNPQVVADAVVAQVLSGKGRQIILAGDLGPVASIRGWPHWLSQTLIHLTDGKVELAKPGIEKTGG
jgi:hypothetical protein